MNRFEPSQHGQAIESLTNQMLPSEGDGFSAETNCLNTRWNRDLWPEYEVMKIDKSHPNYQLDIPWFVNSTASGNLHSCQHAKNDELRQDGSSNKWINRTYNRASSSTCSREDCDSTAGTNCIDALDSKEPCWNLWPEYEVMKIDESHPGYRLEFPWFVNSTAAGTLHSCQYAENDDAARSCSSNLNRSRSSCHTPVFDDAYESLLSPGGWRFPGDGFPHKSTESKENVASSLYHFDCVPDKTVTNRGHSTRASSALEKSRGGLVATLLSSSTQRDQRQLHPLRQVQPHSSRTQDVHSTTRHKHGAYECEECHKVFNGSSGYKRHMLVHTGHKPFRCPLCDFCFSLKHNMQRHVRSIHRRLK